MPLPCASKTLWMFQALPEIARAVRSLFNYQVRDDGGMDPGSSSGSGWEDQNILKIEQPWFDNRLPVWCGKKGNRNSFFFFFGLISARIELLLRRSITWNLPKNAVSILSSVLLVLFLRSVQRFYNHVVYLFLSLKFVPIAYTMASLVWSLPVQFLESLDMGSLYPREVLTVFYHGPFCEVWCSLGISSQNNAFKCIE